MKNAVVIGLGSISSFHIDAILNCANLYGVCDVDTKKADDISQKYKCKAFYDIKDAVKDENVDTVHICTPHYLHFEQAKLAAEHGKDVVLEKPATIDIEDYYELLRIVKEKNIKCMICLQNRYNPCIEYIKNNDLNLGNVLGVKGILTWKRTPEYYTSSNWRGKWQTEGGGLLINQAPHTLDLLAYFGGELTDVKGTISRRVLNGVIEVEDTAEATLYFKNGVRGIFYGTTGHADNSSYDLEIVYESGVLRYIFGKLLLLKDGDIRVLCNDAHTEGEKAYWGRSHNVIIANYYADGEYPHLEDYEKTAIILDTLLKNKI